MTAADNRRQQKERTHRRQERNRRWTAAATQRASWTAEDYEREATEIAAEIARRVEAGEVTRAPEIPPPASHEGRGMAEQVAGLLRSWTLPD
ncbi:MAG: hypothetical protein V4712_08375 [Pseudomonadota bacterium]